MGKSRAKKDKNSLEEIIKDLPASLMVGDDQEQFNYLFSHYIVSKANDPSLTDDQKIERLSTLFNGLSFMAGDEEYDEEYDADGSDSASRLYGDYEAGVDDDEGFKPKIVEDTGISFRNVGGIKEVKNELKRIVSFLENPSNFQRVGAKLPRGALLKGPPGTGKTLLAKAMAHEAGVPFISASGTDFDASLHGIGPARMRKMMSLAKELVREQRENGDPNPACIVYIDEIDIIGGTRGGGRGTHQEVMMELAQLMDGFNTEDGIMVIASTNRPDVLDPALVRPGRFDLSLEVAAPDVDGRKEILKIITRDRKMPLKADVDLGLVAKKTTGFAGADLNLLVNEAAISAASRPNARKVGMDDFNVAYERVLKGPRSHIKMSKFEKESTALHEAGHAILGLLMEKRGMSKLRNVTILPHVGSLGTTYFNDDKEVYAHTFDKFKSELVVDYGGRVAEELAYGADNVSSGASGDIENATATAWRMVTRFGFNKDLGLLCFDEAAGGYLGDHSSGAANLDPETAKKVFREMKTITDEAYEEATQLLTENFDALVALSQALMEHETLDRDEVIAITGIQPEVKKQVSLKQITKRGPISAPKPANG